MNEVGVHVTHKNIKYKNQERRNAISNWTLNTKRATSRLDL